MSRKRTKKNPKDEMDTMRKIMCDEATNQMKVRNFTKALIGFNQVRYIFTLKKPLIHFRRLISKIQIFQLWLL